MHVNNFRRLRTSQPWPIHGTPPIQQHTTKLKLRRLCNKNTCIFLLTEIPQLGKQGKHSTHSPNHPDTPDLFSTWLDNNKINTCTNLLPGSTSKSPTVNQHIPMLHASQVSTKYLLQVPLVLDTCYHSTKGAPSIFFPALVPHQHEFC